MLALACMAVPGLAQEKAPEGPKSEKAQKAYREATDYVHRRMLDAALESFKKADKQDGGQCGQCQQQMIKYGIELREWKPAEQASEEMIAEAKETKETAIAHYQYGVVLLEEGIDRHKDDVFRRAHEEFGKALVRSRRNSRHASMRMDAHSHISNRTMRRKHSSRST